MPKNSDTQNFIAGQDFKPEQPPVYTGKDEFVPIPLVSTTAPQGIIDALTLLDVDGNGVVTASEAANDALLDEAHAALLKLGLRPEVVLAAFGIALPADRKKARDDRDKLRKDRAKTRGNTGNGGNNGNGNNGNGNNGGGTPAGKVTATISKG